MSKVSIYLAAVFGFVVCSTLSPSGQSGTPTSGEVTLKGEIVDVICYAGKGIANGAGAEHIACAKECAKKDGALFGVLTDGDGMFKITGDYTANHHARLLEYIGKEVEVTGTRTRYLDYSTAIKASKIVLPKKAS